MRLPRSLAAVLTFLPFAATMAQVPNAKPITRDSARVLLGTDPVAVPNTPARFYAMPQHAVIVVQEVDSGLSVAFQETRGPTAFPINQAVPCPDGYSKPTQDAYIGRPSCEELRLRLRERYRYVAKLNVYLLYDRQVRVALSRPRDWQRWIPYARFINLDGADDLRAEGFVGRVEPIRN
ncbi:MAG TPA: hypothetical protein VKB63_08400 [Gemmatimonadales bacterium]|nr:hypothetical protein [Gemmatimonadales bacterium]